MPFGHGWGTAPHPIPVDHQSSNCHVREAAEDLLADIEPFSPHLDGCSALRRAVSGPYPRNVQFGMIDEVVGADCIELLRPTPAIDVQADEASGMSTRLLLLGCHALEESRREHFCRHHTMGPEPAKRQPVVEEIFGRDSDLCPACLRAYRGGHGQPSDAGNDSLLGQKSARARHAGGPLQRSPSLTNQQASTSALQRSGCSDRVHRTGARAQLNECTPRHRARGGVHIGWPNENVLEKEPAEASGHLNSHKPSCMSRRSARQ